MSCRFEDFVVGAHMWDPEDPDYCWRVETVVESTAVVRMVLPKAFLDAVPVPLTPDSLELYIYDRYCVGEREDLIL